MGIRAFGCSFDQADGIEPGQECGQRFRGGVNTEFFGECAGDIIEGASGIEQGGDVMLFFFQAEKAARNGVLDYVIVGPVFGLAGDNEVVFEFRPGRVDGSLPWPPIEKIREGEEESIEKRKGGRGKKVLSLES
jgi:hypothetical protein